MIELLIGILVCSIFSTVLKHEKELETISLVRVCVTFWSYVILFSTIVYMLYVLLEP